MNAAETTAAARSIFDAAVSDARAKDDADLVAKRELLREFFTNPEFRAAMKAEVARINGVR